MSRTNPASRQLEAAERRNFVINLKLQGATYRQIAEMAIEKFGIDKLPRGWDEFYAYKDLKRELDKLQKQNEDAAREALLLDLERLDKLYLVVWQQAKQGHLGAVDRLLKIMERRAKLLGLDKNRLDVTSGDKPIVNLVWDYGNSEDATATLGASNDTQ